jgi:dTDP-4-amino-4,6-dideoxygalactose transaminase
MLDVFANDASDRIDLLDFACGTGELLRLVQDESGNIRDERGKPAISYLGVDISELALQHARAKFSTAKFLQLDILKATNEELASLSSDYCVISGLFTVKRGLSHDQMWDFLTRVIGRLWPRTRKAMAFNVMSKQVNRERGDLFHVSLDQMALLLHELAGRSVIFRADYGLFEYTCYVSKQPRTSLIARPAREPATLVPPAPDASMVCRPLLPAAEQIRPYLEEIDRRRWYTNFGTGAFKLAARLATHFGLENSQCVTASSGTDALTAALIAVAGRAQAQRPFCLMPSYTFVGTAAAALNAGYQPYFVDIDADSLAVSPEQLVCHPMLRECGAIIVVAPYGRQIVKHKWEEWSVASGVPVIIDAAAGFDSINADPKATLGNLPVMVSLHATKVFGVGEGGIILCRDAELVQRCGRAMNFGFLGSREAFLAGFNGKMSEYHAAVGLAALDAWPRTRAGFLATAEAYRRAAQRSGLGEKVIAEAAWASSYVLYRAETATAAAAAERSLAKARIDFRLWYGIGCHRHPAYAGFPRDPLPVTEDVSPRVIGLPVSVDLSEEAVDKVITILARI